MISTTRTLLKWSILVFFLAALIIAMAMGCGGSTPKGAGGLGGEAGSGSLVSESRSDTGSDISDGRRRADESDDPIGAEENGQTGASLERITTHLSTPAAREFRRDKTPEIAAPWGGFEMSSMPLRVQQRSSEDSRKNAPFEIVLQDGHTEQITSVKYTRDGRLMITASHDRKIKIWTKEGELLRSITVPGELHWMVLAPQGNQEVIWAGNKKNVYCLDLFGGTLKTLFGARYAAAVVVPSPDGRQLLTTSGANTVVIRNGEFEPTKEVKAHRYKITDLVYSPTGDFFVTGGPPTETAEGWKTSARVWSPQGALIANLEVKKPAGIMVAMPTRGRSGNGDASVISNVKSVDVSPDGKTIAIVGADNQVNLWRKDGTAIGQMKKKWFRHETATMVRFTRDGRSLLLFLRNAVIKIGLDGRDEGGFERSDAKTWSEIGDVAISPDGGQIAVGVGKSSGDNGKGDIFIWNRFGVLQRHIRMDAPLVTAVAVSPNRNKLVFETARGESSLVFRPGQSALDVIEGSAGYYRNGKEYQFKKNKTGSQFTIVDHRGQRSMKMSWMQYGIPLPDGNFALVSRGANHAIEIYDAAGSRVKTVKYNGHGLGTGSTLAMSPDLSFFAVEAATRHGGYHAVTSILLENGEAVARFDVKAPFESLAVGPDSRTIAVGHSNGDISFWSLDGTLLKRFEGHATAISAMTYDNSGKYFISASTDRTVRIWEMATGKWTALVILDDGEWVAYDAGGRFDCSSGGRQRVRLVRGHEVFDFRQFWDDFFTPGLLAKVMKGTRLQDVDVSLKMAKAPNVTIAVVRTPKPSASANDTDTAVLNVCATSNGSGVGEFFIYHNGRVIDANSRGISRVQRGGCREFEVSLSPGYNSFVGAAYDAGGVIFGQSSSVNVNYVPKALKRPAMHILAVGISEYQDRNIDLLYPADDATSIAEILKENASSLYGDIYVETLLNRQGTRKNIQRKLDTIAKKAKPEDTVILYFAGHGETEKGAYYFLGHDADITNLKGSALTIDAFSRFSQTASANKIAIFLDTCKSGAATKQIGNLAMARSIEERKIIASLAKERGIAVFSAAGTDELAFEIKSLRHGIFTYCVIDFLKNKRYDIASNNMISVSKLLSMVSRATRDMAYKHLKVAQTPILYMFGDDFSLGYLN